MVGNAPARGQSTLPTPESIIATLIQLGKRLQIVEERLDNLRDHLEILDNNLRENSKSQTEKINSIWETLKEFQEQLKENTELFHRLADRIELFATKEQVKVLERYINMWNPLDGVTRKEVEEIVDEKLKEKRKAKK